MKNAMKKLLSLALVAMVLISAVPVQANAAGSVNIKFVLPGQNDDFSMTYMEGDPVFAGKIAGYYGVDVTKFIVDGEEYSADESVGASDGMVIYINNMDGLDASQEEEKPEQKPEEDKPEATTYTILLNVYQIKDNEAKEWTSKNVTLSKNSTTLSELVEKSGYGSYESVYAMINGATFEGRAAIAIEDGDQVDLFVTPKATNNRPGNDNKPEGKPENDDKHENNKPENKPENDKNDKPSSNKGDKVTLRVFHNDGTSNYTDITCRTTDGLLDVIESNKELSNLTRDGYKLIGWAFEANNDYNKEWIAAQHKVSDDDDLRVYADWQETIPGKDEKPNKNDKDDKDDGDDEVLLKIYVNGNTKSAAKVVDMDAYDNDGKITLTEATKVVNKYYEAKYDDDDMDIDGLFTSKTWNDGDYSMKNAEKSIEVNEKGDTIIYVMVRDAQKISSGTADSTNPKTGDTIFVAVTIMALSATALAAVYVFNKKRAGK